MFGQSFYRKTRLCRLTRKTSQIHGRKQISKVSCIVSFICTYYHCVLSHISNTGKIAYIPTKSSLPSYNGTITFKVCLISISAQTVASINGIFACRMYFFCRDAFSATKA